MTLEFFGNGTHPMTDGRVAIKSHCYGDLSSKLLVLRTSEKILRIVPYSYEADIFFRSLPEDDRVRKEHYERILSWGIEDPNQIQEREDSSRILMRTLDDQGRFNFHKRIPNQTQVQVRGYSSYMEIEFPDLIDKLLEKRE